VIEDGASAYRAKLVQVYRNYYQISCLNWHPSSPCLNTIENIWNLLKNCYNARNLEPAGKEQARTMLLEEWNLRSERDIQQFVYSISEFIQVLIDANGTHMLLWY
jgi:hypothetical protein